MAVTRASIAAPTPSGVAAGASDMILTAATVAVGGAALGIVVSGLMRGSLGRGALVGAGLGAIVGAVAASDVKLA